MKSLSSLASLAATLTALTATGAFAHPGHGTTDPGTPVHYLVEPSHLVVLLLALGLMALALSTRGKSASGWR